MCEIYLSGLVGGIARVSDDMAVRRNSDMLIYFIHMIVGLALCQCRVHVPL